MPLLRALTSALAAAHAVHVLHRDVKPGNVLLGRDGAIRLTDFGIASFVSAQMRRTLFGTPGYMPPETLRGKGFDQSGDLFALGAVAYRCLSGRSAFGGRTTSDVLMNTLKGRMTPLREACPDAARGADRPRRRAARARSQEADRGRGAARPRPRSPVDGAWMAVDAARPRGDGGGRFRSRFRRAPRPGRGHHGGPRGAREVIAMNEIRLTKERALASKAAVLLALAVWIHGGSAVVAGAQDDAAARRSSIWRAVAADGLGPSTPGRRFAGVSPRTEALDRNELLAVLERTPMERTEDARQVEVVLDLPWPTGGFRRFRIEESPIMEPGLAAQFPEIRTYRGQGLDDPASTARLDWTPAGLHAMVLSAEGTVYVDPYAPGDTTNYVSFFRRDYERTDGHVQRCEVTGSEIPAPEEAGTVEPFTQPANGATLRTYRLAVAATGEYTAFYGGTVGGAMAGIATTMNRVNAIYERDFAVRMVLVANNNSVVYTNAATDPYSNGSGSAMLGQNQANLTAVIGAGNYDVGHVFSTGGGGVATLRSVCNAGTKARGVTGSGSPIGDAFDVDYVAHEMGHQFGGNHTFNGSTGSCLGNRNAATAFEPGSGTTIMAYAGICGAEDLQPHSDDYFHAGNQDEIIAFLLGSGGTCAAASATGNTPPIVDAGPDYTIPFGTPFTLTAVGSDANGDTRTYDWEEVDAGNPAPPNTDDGSRAIFRSFAPTTSPSRTFPRLSDILGNVSTLGESLPVGARTLKLRVTVRDNRAGGGGTAADDAVITVAAAGPFRVTQPNVALSWPALSRQSVAWNVASTSLPPVSAANVKISLSTDGGNTFPVELAASTPNDGSELITVPSQITATARIKVEAVGNVFFDVSNASFAITASSTAALTCPTASVAPGAVFSTTVSGGSSALDWLATYPAGAPNSPVPAFLYVPLPRPTTVSLTAPTALGVYDLRLFANDGFTLIGSCAYQVATLPSLSINDVTVTEGNFGPVDATFTVTLSPAATGTVTVFAATANGTTTAGSDFLANAGTLTFAPGVTVQTFPVTVIGDTTPEATETFSVNLTSPSGATIQDAQGQGTITNDDGAPVTLTCPSSPVLPGASFTTTVTAGSSALDWMASYAVGAPNSPVPPYQYVPLPRPITRTVTAPSAVGMYELRLFANDTFTSIGSCTYQVSTGPALSINDVTVTEGNSGTVSATFSVTLSPVAAGTVTVNFATTNGTASAGSDYAANAAMLSFAPGEGLKTVVVGVSGDTTPETTETFFVNLNTPSGATILDAQGQGTITNDDGAPPPVTCPSSPVMPGATFSTTVTAGSSALDWMASYAAGAPNSPVPPYQYVPLPRPITRTVTAPGAVGMYELRLFANDSFTLIGSCTYQVSTGPALSINDVTVTEGNSGTTTATFNVTLSPVSAGTVSVNFNTANGTATAGTDYATASGTLEFAPGDSLKTVTVNVSGDTEPEINETFFVNLTTAAGATFLDGQGLGTITNDDGAMPVVTCPTSPVTPGASFTTTVSAGTSARDWVASYPQFAPNTPVPSFRYVPLPRPATLMLTAPSTVGSYELRLFANDGFGLIGSCNYMVSNGPGLSITGMFLPEGNVGTSGGTVYVTLTPASTGTVTVQYATADGTATAGSDYVADSGTLTFPPGATSVPLNVTTKGDTTPEAEETFYVNLSNPTGASILDGQAVFTIANDDGPLPALTCPPSPVTPGSAFSVTVSGGSSVKDWVANYPIGAPVAPAPPGWQYVPLPRPAMRTMTAPTTVGLYEVRLFANDGFSLIGSCTYQASTGPTLSIDDVAVTEGQSGTVSATFTVTLSPTSMGPVTVNFATAPGTATVASDYVAQSGTLTFAAGQSAKTVTVVVNGDTVAEPHETFFVNLSAASGAVDRGQPGPGPDRERRSELVVDRRRHRGRGEHGLAAHDQCELHGPSHAAGDLDGHGALCHGERDGGRGVVRLAPLHQQHADHHQ